MTKPGDKEKLFTCGKVRFLNYQVYCRLRHLHQVVTCQKNLINKQKNFCAFGYNLQQAASLNIKTEKYCFFKIVINSLLEQQLKQIVEELLFFS